MSEKFPVNDMRQMTQLGRSIENDSFAVIDREAGEHSYSDDQWEIVRRVIHATADFEFKDLMRFSPTAVEEGIKALENGCSLIVDVKMIEAGLNQQRLDSYGIQVYNYISDEDVIQTAKKENSTRAVYSMRKARDLHVLENSVVAIGNAPTALLEISRIIREENIRPSLVIGVPVGFVSAAESKEEIMKQDVPYIAIHGRKGGSAIAVSVIHALLKISADRKLK